MTTVYVSSTYQDLKEYRAAIERQLRRLTGFDVRAMEDYVARDERPKDECIADVKGCDVYVGVFAFRYGFIPPGETLSITELEYRAAREAKKECLIFLLDEGAAKMPLTDFYTGEGESGKRVRELRKELGETHLASFFTSPEELAGLVTAAVRNWERRTGAAPPTTQPAGADPTPLFRELRSSLLIACAPADEHLAQAYAEIAQCWLERPVVMSAMALFADDEAGFSALETTLTQCEAGLVLLSRATLASLLPRADAVAKVLATMRARLGFVRLLSCGELGGAMPAAWRIGEVIEAPAEAPTPVGAPTAAIVALQRWLRQAIPFGAGLSVGLPFCVLAMKHPELANLPASPAAGGPSGAAGPQSQLLAEVDALAAAGVDWRARYGSAREDWQPFGPNGLPISAIVEGIVAQVNAQQPAKLRDRRIKPQWYPFDVLEAEAQGQETGLSGIYGDMARTGCVLIVDELSLVHPVLIDAFRSSPLVNNERVSIVTVSPDPRRSALAQMLESEARRKLVGAFERFEKYLDPQCELAVSDARRLKRWLHASLPETATSLRDPRPNADKLAAFFRAELGTDAPRRAGGDYLWGRGGHS